MSTKQAVIVAAATAAFAPLAYARGVPPLQRASLNLADHAVVCYYSNRQHFLADDRRLEVVVRQTGLPSTANCEDLASDAIFLISGVVAITFFNAQLDDLNAEAKGENRENTVRKLTAVCSAVSQAIEHKFDKSFESLCDYVHGEDLGYL
ncbi:hypothetical protein FOZ63_008928, partial [Perkinsus olseni]